MKGVIAKMLQRRDPLLCECCALHPEHGDDKLTAIVCSVCGKHCQCKGCIDDYLWEQYTGRTEEPALAALRLTGIR